MGTLPSGGQLVKSECLERLTVNTSCVGPEVVTVKVEASCTNMVNTVLFINFALHVILCILMALHLSYGAVFDGEFDACVS